MCSIWWWCWNWNIINLFLVIARKNKKLYRRSFHRSWICFCFEDFGKREKTAFLISLYLGKVGKGFFSLTNHRVHSIYKAESFCFNKKIKICYHFQFLLIISWTNKEILNKKLCQIILWNLQKEHFVTNKKTQQSHLPLYFLVLKRYMQWMSIHCGSPHSYWNWGKGRSYFSFYMEVSITHCFFIFTGQAFWSLLKEGL